ncbi:MAG: phosphoribosylpyrophosphate synthetase [Chitinophagales bacterium]
MFAYDTVTEAIGGLKKRGYSIDFNLDYNRIICHETPISLMPSEFEITEVYRFEGDSDPADEAVIYAIESKHGHKGLLVNGFGISADSISDEMIEKLKLNHRQA